MLNTKSLNPLKVSNAKVSYGLGAVVHSIPLNDCNADITGISLIDGKDCSRPKADIAILLIGRKPAIRCVREPVRSNIQKQTFK